MRRRRGRLRCGRSSGITGSRISEQQIIRRQQPFGASISRWARGGWLCQRLKDLMESRWADGRYERLPELALDLFGGQLPYSLSRTHCISCKRGQDPCTIGSCKATNWMRARCQSAATTRDGRRRQRPWWLPGQHVADCCNDSPSHGKQTDNHNRTKMATRAWPVTRSVRILASSTWGVNNPLIKLTLTVADVQNRPDRIRRM